MSAIGSGVSDTSPPPSARARYRRSPASSGNVRRKTILVPSRDQTGSVSFADSLTIAVVTPVSGSTVKISPSAAKATLPLAAGPYGAGSRRGDPLTRSSPTTRPSTSRATIATGARLRLEMPGAWSRVCTSVIRCHLSGNRVTRAPYLVGDLDRRGAQCLGDRARVAAREPVTESIFEVPGGHGALSSSTPSAACSRRVAA